MDIHIQPLSVTPSVQMISKAMYATRELVLYFVRLSSRLRTFEHVPGDGEEEEGGRRQSEYNSTASI